MSLIQAPLSTDDLYEISSSLLIRNTHSEYLVYPGKCAALKSLLYALTSSENNYQVDVDKLLEAVTKFGLISPFPYFVKLHASHSLDKCFEREQLKGNTLESRPQSSKGKPLIIGRSKKNLASTTMQSLKPLNFLSSTTEGIDRRPSSVRKQNNGSETTKQKQSVDGNETSVGKFGTGGSLIITSNSPHDGMIRLDSTSSLLAQHFSLIRELRTYMHDFKQLIENESEIKDVWRCFENLAKLLENGCNYLSFPCQL